MQKSADSDARQVARDYLKSHLAPNPDAFQQALRDMYAEAFAAGTHAAAAGGKVLSGFEAVDTSVDWSAWEPGYAAAAHVVDNAGLSALLDGAGQTIAGLTDTTIDQMGTRLADGLAAGDTVDSIGDQLTSFVGGDAERADMIANTEANRAMSMASMETYAQNGVSGKEWLTAAPCDVCAENEGQGVIPLDEDFASGDSEPPAHPNCRCSVSPAELPGVDAQPADATADDTASSEGGE